MKKLIILSVILKCLVLQAQEVQEEVVDLNQDLLLHYKFEENTNDSSANSNHGTSYGGVQYTKGRVGEGLTAIRLDGVDDYIQLPNISSLKPSLPVTFSFDIKYESTDATKRAVFNTSYEEDYNSGVYFTSQSSTGKYAVGYGDGTYNYTSSNIRAFIGDSTIVEDEWHFLTIVVRGAQDMSIYEDGVELRGTFSGNGGALSYGSLSGVIGKHDQSNVLEAYYFKGFIDEFKYWSKALSTSEVSYLYNSYVNDESLSIQQNLIFEKDINIEVKESILTIEPKQKIKRVELYNILGERLFSSYSSNRIDLRSYSSKILILKVQDDSGKIFVKKIIR